MVLLTEGLSVIIKAILGSRCIFQRMRNYATYACATTIRIVTTFSLLACVWQFTYPPFLVLIIAVLNDGTIMTVRFLPLFIECQYPVRDSVHVDVINFNRMRRSKHQGSPLLHREKRINKNIPQVSELRRKMFRLRLHL
jgi:hypothetical protein